MNIVESIKDCILLANSLGVKTHYVVLTEAMFDEFCEAAWIDKALDDKGCQQVGHFTFSINEEVDKAFVMPNSECAVSIPATVS